MKSSTIVKLFACILILASFCGCVNNKIPNGIDSTNSTSPTSETFYTDAPLTTGTDTPISESTLAPNATDVPSVTNAPANTNTTTVTKPKTTTSNTTTLAPNTTLPPNPVGNPINLEDDSAVIPSDLLEDFNAIKNSIIAFQNTLTITKYISNSTVDQRTTEANRLIKISTLIRYTCPELFYIGIQTAVSTVYNSQLVRLTISFPDMFKYYSVQDLISMRNEINAKISVIVNTAKALPNDFEREVYIHDYLIKNIKYTDNTSGNDGYIRSIYGGLIKGEGVCEAYARSFQALMLKLGVETYLISGKASGVDHLWNIIKLNNNYYHVDLTWDDNDSSVPDLTLETSKYLIDHTYFNQTDDFINKSRDFGGTTEYTPIQNLVCSATEMNYYCIRGTLVNSLDDFKTVILRDKDSFPDGYYKCIEVRFTVPVTSTQIKNEMKLIKLSAGSYSYQYEDRTDTGVVRIFGW